MTTKCIHCSNLINARKIEPETDSTKNYIGYCRKYNIKVIDSLCGCEVTGENVKLMNFPKEETR